MAKIGTGGNSNWIWLIVGGLLFTASPRLGAQGFLKIKEGYLWDPEKQEHVIPRGIAYQNWNPPVGADQSLDQLEYDLIEFKKIYANSVRVDFVWSQIETNDNQYDWAKPDFLVAKAEELGLKLFVIIGYQYPPTNWFPRAYYGFNDRNTVSDVLNYEHPEARRLYQEHIAEVAARYKDRAVIGAWILGNEYAYFDLWELPELYVTRRFLGYDPVSQENFRRFLEELYHTNIAALNANWGATYTNFESVIMPQRYPADRHDPGYHDLIQWRKRSIGDFVALGAQAAKLSDPNHLITYSMVGGIFSGIDANYTCEDAKTIVHRCLAARAPLDFWSLNNYAWTDVGSELRSADFGIAKYHAQSGLPVMISETGHSSTDDKDRAAERQAKAVPGQIWEALMSGAIGAHLFHWNDRDWFTGPSRLREAGFGIVGQNRLAKGPVFGNVLEMFRRMANLKIERLLAESADPPSDIHLFWTVHSDMGWPRANWENAMLWGALKRLGYQPRMIDDEEFEQAIYTNAAALLLSRTYQMDPAHLEALATRVLPAGVHVHADADLPGQFNAYHRPNPNWASRMSSIFGLNVSGAIPGWDEGVTNTANLHAPINFFGVTPLGRFNRSYTDLIFSWKIWHGIRTVSGTTIVNHTGKGGSQNPIPALVITNHPRAKAAINTFGLGDIFVAPLVRQWSVRYSWLGAIYRDYFQIQPAMDLSGPGSEYVVPDYRLCRNGSILLSLLNEHTNAASVVLSAPVLLAGKRVENLLSGRIMADPSDGTLRVDLSDDEYVLLYAYPHDPDLDDSLVNSNPNKIWFMGAPIWVWPNENGFEVDIGYHLQETNLTLTTFFESASPLRKIVAQTAALPVNGRNSSKLLVPIPDPDLNDRNFPSSVDGGEYQLRAALRRGAEIVAETSLPIRLAWGVKPLALPKVVQPGATYQIPVQWQELPSYLQGNTVPLSRADLWESLQATAEHFQIILELQSSGQAVASGLILTSSGSGQQSLTITVPSQAAAPFTWKAVAHTAPNVISFDVEESFEGRRRGALLELLAENPQAMSPIHPWSSFVWPPNTYPGDPSYDPNKPFWGNEGVHLAASHGSLSAFLVVINPPIDLSVFGLAYRFNNLWALPSDRTRWTNYVFSYAFKEQNRLPCLLELQVKSTDNDWIQFSRLYNPGADGWDSIGATLDRFSGVGAFNPNKVQALALNIRMLTNGVYIGSFDNIRFDAPDLAGAPGTPYALYTSDNDSLLIDRIQRNASGDPVLSWPALKERVYTLYYTDSLNLVPFALLPLLTNISVETDRWIEATDTTAAQSQRRYYLISVRPAGP